MMKRALPSGTALFLYAEIDKTKRLATNPIVLWPAFLFAYHFNQIDQRAVILSCQPHNLYK